MTSSGMTVSMAVIRMPELFGAGFGCGEMVAMGFTDFRLQGPCLVHWVCPSGLGGGHVVCTNSRKRSSETDSEVPSS